METPDTKYLKIILNGILNEKPTRTLQKYPKMKIFKYLPKTVIK